MATGAIEVMALKHDAAKRRNIPTADTSARCRRGVLRHCEERRAQRGATKQSRTRAKAGLLRLRLAMTKWGRLATTQQRCRAMLARRGIETVGLSATFGVSMMKQPAVYMMANRRNGTLYTGVTSNLPRRAHEHREGLVPGFTAKYGCKMLVWYEIHATMTEAIAREKTDQGWLAPEEIGTDRNDESAMAGLVRGFGMTGSRRVAVLRRCLDCVVAIAPRNDAGA